MNNILNEVKITLGLSSSDKDELLLSLIQRSSNQVINHINEKSLPNGLEYIVIELVIARYNRIGSEGIKSENSDGVSFSYKDDLLEDYKKDLNKWIENNKTTSKNLKLRLI